MIKSIADKMADGGWRDLGYVYISIDDCWTLKTRDSNGRLQPDPERFPNGIKALADYVSMSNIVQLNTIALPAKRRNKVTFKGTLGRNKPLTFARVVLLKVWEQYIGILTGKLTQLLYC